MSKEKNSKPQSKTETILVNPEDRKKFKAQISKIGDAKVGPDIYYFIKSRYKILYVRSSEELRVINLFRIISLAEGYDLFQWDCSRGMLDSHTLRQIKSNSNEAHDDPLAALAHIVDQAKSDSKNMSEESVHGKGHIEMLLDFHAFLKDGVQNFEISRKFKEFFQLPSVCCIVIIAPTFECPDSLEKEFTLVDFPYPSKDELRVSFNRIKKEIPAEYPKAIQTAEQNEDILLESAAGLTLVEAENAYALSLVKKRTFDVPTILSEKKQVIRKNGIMEFRDSKYSFDDVGGLDNLKQWLATRRLAFSQEAFDFGLSTPKGVVLAGVPGTGKSLTCDALSNYWQMPLLRLDMGAIFSAHVGESEANVRRVIQLAESISPAILWIDEIEKGIGGIKSSNQTDGGVTNRVFGTLLTWMQEKTSPVFVICTANDITGLPPEFMRAGRFDEIFFLDLPNHEQRMDVIQKLIFKKKRNPDDFDIIKIADASNFYSPAEIEKGINNALFVAFSGKREMITDDIVSELSKFQPLYNSRREEIENMRSWALGDDGNSGRAVLANSLAKDNKPLSLSKRQIQISDEDL